MNRDATVHTLECAQLPTSLRNAVESLAQRSTRGAIARSYARECFRRYPQVIVVHHGAAAMHCAAALFIERHTTTHGTLVYFGPAFSEGRSYVAGFVDVLEALASEGRAFTVAMEIENLAVFRMLRRLLPSHAYPDRGSAPPPPAIREHAASMLAHVTHVVDFDPETMTSRAASPMRRNPRGRERYLVAIVRCDGTPLGIESLAGELRRNAACVLQRTADDVRPNAHLECAE